MFTRPNDLTDPEVVTALVGGWTIAVVGIEHQPVGFGSHHWIASSDGGRWFVTVDDLEARRRDRTETRRDAAGHLTTALQASRTLHDSGLEFVVAPLPTVEGSPTHPINSRYVASLYPYVEGISYSWGRFETRGQRLAVLDRIIEIHHASKLLPGVGRPDDFMIPSRAELVSALRRSPTPWGPGPFAEPARLLLEDNAEGVRNVLARYDHLVSKIASRVDRHVLTHGEPHRANTITTSEGVALIDWDTALRAPPERDLWAMIDEDPDVSDEYARRTGVTLDETALTLYRLWWDLCEIASYIAQFRHHHGENEDTRTSWDALRDRLNTTRQETTL